MVGRPQSSELVELIARMERIENEAREVIAEKAGGSEQPIIPQIQAEDGHAEFLQGRRFRCGGSASARTIELAFSEASRIRHEHFLVQMR
jgi:hypothetical protein